VGAGVYFLEPYDPKKIPVLFVHGAMGHPGNWKHLVGTLDRTRFQPWLIYYPTAPHLDQIARGLVRMLATLQVKYGFTRLVLVAHSMGGLVTRAAVNYALESTQGKRRIVALPAFLSISSPWNGHAGAEEGVKYAPVVAPSWEDMAPGSPFIRALPQTALPPETEYTLLFSYRGTSEFSRVANDGTVTVASELSMPIQRQALHVMGFDETHTSILESADVAEHLKAILDRAAGAVK
jgi:pimeloyl-ACP methyl ester carboxylesterase